MPFRRHQTALLLILLILILLLLTVAYGNAAELTVEVSFSLGQKRRQQGSGSYGRCQAVFYTRLRLACMIEGFSISM